MEWPNFGNQVDDFIRRAEDTKRVHPPFDATLSDDAAKGASQDSSTTFLLTHLLSYVERVDRRTGQGQLYHVDQVPFEIKGGKAKARSRNPSIADFVLHSTAVKGEGEVRIVGESKRPGYFEILRREDVGARLPSTLPDLLKETPKVQAPGKKQRTRKKAQPKSKESTTTSEHPDQAMEGRREQAQEKEKKTKGGRGKKAQPADKEIRKAQTTDEEDTKQLMGEDAVRLHVKHGFQQVWQHLKL